MIRPSKPPTGLPIRPRIPVTHRSALRINSHRNDQLERLAALHDQALDVINQARRIVDASWEQQVEERM